MESSGTYCRPIVQFSFQSPASWNSKPDEHSSPRGIHGRLRAECRVAPGLRLNQQQRPSHHQAGRADLAVMICCETHILRDHQGSSSGSHCHELIPSPWLFSSLPRSIRTAPVWATHNTIWYLPVWRAWAGDFAAPQAAEPQSTPAPTRKPCRPSIHSLPTHRAPYRITYHASCVTEPPATQDYLLHASGQEAASASAPRDARQECLLDLSNTFLMASLYAGGAI